MYLFSVCLMPSESLCSSYEFKIICLISGVYKFWAQLTVANENMYLYSNNISEAERFIVTIVVFY